MDINEDIIYENYYKLARIGDKKGRERENLTTILVNSNFTKSFIIIRIPHSDFNVLQIS